MVSRRACSGIGPFARPAAADVFSCASEPFTGDEGAPPGAGQSGAVSGGVP
jgi:hypothetical protein